MRDSARSPPSWYPSPASAKESCIGNRYSIPALASVPVHECGGIELNALNRRGYAFASASAELRERTGLVSLIYVQEDPDCKPRRNCRAHDSRLPRARHQGGRDLFGRGPGVAARFKGG